VRQTARLFLGLAGLILTLQTGHADDYPTRRVTLIAPWPPAGAIDTLGLESQEFRVAGLSLHCIHTLTATEGTIVIHSQCNLLTNVGEWRVVSGTGAGARITLKPQNQH